MSGGVLELSSERPPSSSADLLTQNLELITDGEEAARAGQYGVMNRTW